MINHTNIVFFFPSFSFFSKQLFSMCFRLREVLTLLFPILSDRQLCFPIDVDPALQREKGHASYSYRIDRQAPTALRPLHRARRPCSNRRGTVLSEKRTRASEASRRGGGFPLGPPCLAFTCPIETPDHTRCDRALFLPGTDHEPLRCHAHRVTTCRRLEEISK